jgi:spermidine/putrescine transport system permease protein
VSTALAGVRTRVADRPALLVVPVVAFELVVFVGALAYLLRLSLSRSVVDGAYAAGTWTVANYAALLGDAYLQGRLLYSLGLGGTVTLLTLVLGFVYAYAAARADGRRRAVLLGAVLVELLLSIVIKVYAWVPLLAPEGAVNAVLLGLGAVREPLRLLGTDAGVVVGLVYSMLPYVVLPTYATLATMDWTTVAAARDLGASRPRSVLAVVVPQATPGLLAGGVTAFAWSTVAFAAPAVLGSPAQSTVAGEAARFVDVTYDWPRAAALSVEAVVVVVFVAACAVALVRRFGPRGATEGLL